MDQHHAALTDNPTMRAALRMVRSAARALLLALPLLFLAYFYFYPLVAILRVSFAPTQESSGSDILSTIVQPFFWQVIWFTTWQAAAWRCAACRRPATASSPGSRPPTADLSRPPWRAGRG